MTSNAQGLISELISVLNAAAMYNDKGYIWSGHNLVQREQTQAAFHQKMLQLIAQIVDDALPPELVNAIASGAAARDGCGYFSSLVQGSYES